LLNSTIPPGRPRLMLLHKPGLIEPTLLNRHLRVTRQRGGLGHGLGHYSHFLIQSAVAGCWPCWYLR
jgi:hypothetical protein